MDRAQHRHHHDINIDNLGSDEPGDHMKTMIISFRLSYSTPLMPIFKAIKFEFARMLENIRQMISSAIYLQRIKPPSQGFLDVVSRSRLVFDNLTAAVFLMRHLPELVKSLIKEVVVTDSCTYTDCDGTRWLWRELSPGGLSEVTDTLRTHLPNARTVAIQAPFDLQ